MGAMGFDGSWGRLFLPTRIFFTESASRIDTLGYFWAFFFSFRFSAFDFIFFWFDLFFFCSKKQ